MDELTMEEKCENLMNVVVESRKRFGKMCIEYEQKTSLMENKLLNLQLETISSYRFKPKQTIPTNVIEDMCKENEDYTVTLVERTKRIERLKKKLQCTQDIVFQIKTDNVGRKLREPLSAEVLLAKAKKKHVI